MTAPQPIDALNHIPPSSTSPKLVMSTPSSRDSSPAPFSLANSAVFSTRSMRSRKNSADPSPNRKSSHITSHPTPSALAIENALTNGDGDSTRKTRSSQPNGASEAQKETPTWPTSNRLKSPSPSSSSRRNLSNGKKHHEHPAPNIVIRAATDSSMDSISVTSPDSDSAGPLEGRKQINPFHLETVQESITPMSPELIANHNLERFV
jgi:hypothetical protein